PKMIDAMNSDPVLEALQWGNQIVSLILGAIIAIAVHRMILLDDVQKGVYFYWRMTREEWLYIAAWIGYFILIMIAIALPIAGHFYWVSTHEAHAALPNMTNFRDPHEMKHFVESPIFNDPRLIIAGFMSFLFALI